MITNKTLFVGIAVVAAIILKFLYPLSSTTDLQIILRPVSELISHIVNEDYVLTEKGFYFSQLNVVIDKSCSGFNFFIISFCVFSSVVPFELFGPKKSIVLLFATALTAYGVTIFVNTSRIAGAIALLRFKPAYPWIGEAWVHEAEGAFVYLSTLLITYLVLKNSINQLLSFYAKRLQSQVAPGN